MRRPHAPSRETLLVVVILVLAVTAPLTLFDHYLTRIATTVFILGSMAVAWNLIGGYGDQLSLGHAVFFGIGAYATALLEVRLGITPLLGALVGVGLSSAVALLLGLGAFRLGGTYFALATIAALEICKILATYLGDLTGGALGISLRIVADDPLMLSFVDPRAYYYLGLAVAVLALVVSRTVLRRPLGYRLRAIAQNQEAATLAGVNPLRTKVTALMLSAAVTSICGSLYLQYLLVIDPASTFSLTLSINIALFAIIGGVGLWWGPMLGAALLIPIQQFTSLKLTGNLAPLGEVAFGIILIVVIIARPSGIGAVVRQLGARVMTPRVTR
jgi:branched-chain amino acid transport system permease protein